MPPLRPPVRPCIVHRCPEYALPRKSRCQKHQTEFERSRRQDPELTGRRGSTRRWRRIRARALRRADFRCQGCGKPGVAGVRALEVDHVNGDPNDDRLENLQVLCADMRGPGGCHRLKTKEER
jgi:5-methylcytosine-specific restriction endonuclease McrA